MSDMIRRLIPAIAITVVAGCSGPSPTPRSSDSTPSRAPGPSDSAAQSPAASGAATGIVPDDLFTAPPNVLNLAISTDDALAVVGSIGPDGGQLSTTAADGTTYALDIPPEALLFAKDISMTPIVEVDGWPGDVAPAHVVGVRLEPDGLELYYPATVRITPASPLPEAGVATISFHSDGDDAGLVLFDQGPSEIAIRVEHFSGTASFWPLEESWWWQFEQLRQQMAADTFRNEIAMALGLQQQSQMLGGGQEKPLEELLSGLEERFDRDVLSPRLRNAASGCGEASDAVAAYVAWERQLQLLGVSLQGLTPEEYSRATDDERERYERMRRDLPPELLTLKRDLCFEEQFQRCRETGDFEFLAGFFLGYFRQVEVFGDEVSADDVVLAHSYLERCGLWDLTIESIEDIGVAHPLGPVTQSYHQKRTYPIRWHPSTHPNRWVPGSAPMYGLIGSAVGEGATEIVDATGVVPGCPDVGLTYEGTAPVDEAQIERLIFDQRPNVVTTTRGRDGREYRIERPDEPVPRKVELGLSFGTQGWRWLTCETFTTANYFEMTGGPLANVLFVRNALNTHEWRFDSGPFGATMTITDAYTDTSHSQTPSISVEAIITVEHTPAP